MAVMYSCCRYFSVRLGTILVAITSMIQSLVLGVIFLYWLNNLDQSRENLEEWVSSNKLIYVTDLFQGIQEYTKFYLQSAVVFLMFHICTSALVIYAAFKCNMPLVWPYLVVEFIRLAILFFTHVTAMMLIKENVMDLGLLLLLSISGGFILLGLYYNWFCVVSLCQCLRELKDTRDKEKKVINVSLLESEFKNLKNFTKHIPAMPHYWDLQAVYNLPLHDRDYQYSTLANPTY